MISSAQWIAPKRLGFRFDGSDQVGCAKPQAFTRDDGGLLIMVNCQRTKEGELAQLLGAWDVSVCFIVSQGYLDNLDDFYAFVNKVDDSVIVQRDGRITG